MKKTILFLGTLFLASGIFAQCSDLFFSEYVEGYANNKAVEIYNPTSEAIDLSEYSIARFANGNTAAPPPTETPAFIIQLPEVMLAPYDVYVVVIDMQDTTLWDSQFDKPAWNGYNLIDTLFDAVTEEPLMDSLGNIIFGPQYDDNGAALFGDQYDEKYDLQCKADVFLCPVYEINRAMYFNGNDAVALLTGTEVEVDGSNLIDVIGVIGEDPEVTIMEDAWVSAEGYWLTKDRTLIRNAEVGGGRATLEDVVFQLGGTFTGQEWTSTFKNSFQYLGVHNSVCAPNSTGDIFSCLTGVGFAEINTIPFNMYPNPNSAGMLTIEAAEQIQRIEVYNLLGQIALTQQIGYAAGKVEVNLGNLNPGMYLVNLYFSENQISIQKLVID